MRTPPAAAVARAVAMRDFDPRALVPAVAAFALAGVAAGFAAAALPASPGGAVTLVTEFDRTLLCIAGWVVIFRTIAHISADASADWPLQLFAVGASREAYVISVAIATAASVLFAWIAGAGSFALTLLARTSRSAALMRVIHELPLAPVPLIAASAFAAAVACIFPRALAARIAFALMAAPWVGLWMSIVARGQLDAGAAYFRLLGYAIPRLFVSATLAHNSYMLLYIGAAFALVLFTADRRIGRRE